MRTILFLTSRLPYPPNRGDKVRSNQFLSILASRYHIIPVSLYGRGERKYLKEFKKMYPQALVFYQSWLRMLWNLITGVFGKRPLQVIIYRNKKMQAVIKALTDKDRPVVYAFMIRMVEYLEAVPDCYRISDLTDCISMEYERRLRFLRGLKRLVFSLESKRLRRLERAVPNAVEEVWFISDVDRKKLALSTDKCKIIPNSTLIYPKEKDYRFWGKMVFSGRMSVAHNIHAVEYIRNELLDEILAIYPDLQFDIIGAGPTKRIMDMDGNRNTKVHGFVPDLLEALSESDVFVAPMFFSAGMQNKILEAMAVGVPVVMTETVAESIGCADGIHYLKAGTKDEFITGIKELLGNEDLRKRIGSSAKQFIEEHYSPEIVSQLIYSRINSIME